MIRRFQIEDIIIQDASGITFRALDTETGLMVAVRRFFPFGARGGGLMEDEQTAYNIAIARLAGLRHAALRSVVCGGCDPVDGIPFIATDWVEGTVLRHIVQQRPLSADVAVVLLTQALEVSELLSHVLAEEAVWVETNLDTIVLGDEESGRGFTFWISPLKWLGGDEHSRGLESIIKLTEEIMGWQGAAVHDQAGKGLGTWLKWLRQNASTASLREVRENLAAAVGLEPPPAVGKLVTAAKQPTPRPSSRTALVAIFGLILIAVGLGGWLLTRHRTMGHVPDPVRPPAGPAETAAKLDAQRAAVGKRGGVFSPAESEWLALQKNTQATLEARLVKASRSDSGKTLYLYFSEKPAYNEVRGAVSLKRVRDISEASLAPLIGKTIRLTGTVKILAGRPEIHVSGREAIKASG